ncbi:RluA family pseudouridine synthase [Lachnotalea glycerini]|uniref:Pseudouridine synthase n=1 Tax=Lachnotalea glycerini TaxID=1763509 RepID=A0A318EWU2_9FIRM|nr:RluA family pseudouridine synthase [Lachnotalea glycerini]PXV95546.1 RluA family pseudouridine synthase [Lachnotalea glycerini]
MIQNKFYVDENYSGERIDKYLSELLEKQTRSYIQRLIKDNLVLANGKIVKANYKISIGDLVEITIPDATVLNIEPQNIVIDILYEDEDILIVNKPKGMVVHPSAGHYDGTLVNAIMYHCKDHLSGINGVLRPGIVHRIDMDTTGILVVCKNDASHLSLTEQLKAHSITRKYRAIVHNCMKDEEGRIEGPIGRHPTDRKKMSINYKNGKEAVTHYKVLEHLSNYTYIECQLETGRTHQIRVHMSSINHPLLGDRIYGPTKCPFQLQGQTLHAMILGFLHPRTGKYVEFEAPLPEYFEKLLSILRKK